MKHYEEVSCTILTPRMPMIIRIDGRAFHTYTKKLHHGMREESPWNPVMRDAMTAAARGLMREISGAKIAYLQSDEISVLVTDYDKLSSQAWFDKAAQKVCSVGASIATMEFNNNIRDYIDSGLPAEMFPTTATFDARVFVVPREDVCNYFIWRQRDAEKNSISMLAQTHFSPKQLHGKDGNAKQDMLMLEKGVNWNDLPTWQKRGWCVDRKTITMTVAELEMAGGKVTRNPGVVLDPNTEVTRTVVEPDWEIPIFTKDRGYIDQFVNVDEAPLKGEEP
jgi:tRNA(His) 5'-end guanylyltransferase